MAVKKFSLGKPQNVSIVYRISRAKMAAKDRWCQVSFVCAMAIEVAVAMAVSEAFGR